MLTVDFYLGKGNRLPSLAKTLTDANEAPIVLDSSVSTVKFTLWDFARSTKKIDAGSVVIVTSGGLDGKVRYDWTDADKSLPAGFYYGVFKITYTDAIVLTVPNNGYFVIQIQESWLLFQKGS